VAINRWTNEGSTEYYPVTVENSPQRWGRTDLRGFIMSLSVDLSIAPYIVVFDSTVEVTNAAVIIDGHTHPLPSDHPNTRAAPKSFEKPTTPADKK
jgi:hypothetical protein